MCQNWHIPLKRLSIAYTLSSKVHWQKEKQKSVSLRKQIEAFPSWSVVEKRNHKYEFAEKIEPSCSIIYIENPSFNKEQSQKYAIEILQDFIQNKLQYTSKKVV